MNKPEHFLRFYFLIFTIPISFLCIGQKKTIDQKVDSVLKLMTLNEKVGQMNQYSGNWANTGPITEDGNKLKEIKEGKLGSLLNINGVLHTRELQQLAMQSRLKIPLLFGQDAVSYTHLRAHETVLDLVCR